MKKLYYTLLVAVTGLSAYAQEFDSKLAVARSAYEAGKLEESRFAMQQMLQELDIISGKEILKVLPQKMDALTANTGNDNVSGSSGFAGVITHRDYGTGDKTAELEIISNSPLIGSLNALLSLPFIGNAASGDQKVIKVSGYKGLLQKNTDSGTNKLSYEFQLPISSNLVTLRLPNTTEEEAVKLANLIPVAQIAKLVQ